MKMFKNKLAKLLKRYGFPELTNIPAEILSDNLIEILDDAIAYERESNLIEDTYGIPTPTFENSQANWYRCYHDESDVMYTSILSKLIEDDDGSVEVEQIQLWWSPDDPLWVNWGAGNDKMEEDMILPDDYIEYLFDNHR